MNRPMIQDETQNENHNDNPGILSIYKPWGLKCHRSDDSDWGLVEWLTEKKAQPYFLFQRLDLGTSGIMLLGKTEKAAQEWTEKLKNKTISKQYLFISKTTQQVASGTIVKSNIVKSQGLWVTTNVPPYNSETHFEFVKAWGDYQLWSAKPRTGKAHQIRLHAQSIGLPILGDHQHGGAPFFRLCLHAKSITDPVSNQSWSAEPPAYFSRLEMLSTEGLCALVDALHQRAMLALYGLVPKDTLRMAHLEYPDVRIDQFGSHLWVYDYRERFSPELINQLLVFVNNQPIWVREMRNRGDQPNSSNLVSFGNPQNRWTTTENGLTYELRSDQGLSPGLFLDQRENRKWVKQNSYGLRVLNLFSYTCGFSLSAASGGAKDVVSVDVSTSFLDWGKTNFVLNHFDPHNFEFWTADTMDFLKRTVKIGRKFDLIICDPPSFGRSKRGVFKIEKDLPLLMELCASILAENGKILVSTNYEKWNFQQFKFQALRHLPAKQYSLVAPPLPGLDFIEHQEPILKTLIIKKLDSANDTRSN